MIYVFLIILLAAADRFSKAYFEKNYKLNEFRKIKGNFYLANMQNKGAAYGFLAKKPKALHFLSIFSFFAVFLNFVLAMKDNSSRVLKLGLAFILGGALGNLSDRFRKGYVTDFLYYKFKKAPVFNLADLFVFLGIILTFIFSGKDK